MRRSFLAALFDVLLICFVLSLVSSAVIQRVYGNAWGWVGIHGASMQPTLSDGSLVLSVPAKPEQLRIGDIVVYRSGTLPPIICHRVVEIGPDGIMTQGDASSRVDQSCGLPMVDPKTLYGVVPQIAGRPVAIPALGVLAGSSDNPTGTHLVMALGLSFGFLALGGAQADRRRRRQRR
jgi:signal peptidase I